MIKQLTYHADSSHCHAIINWGHLLLLRLHPFNGFFPGQPG